MARTLKPAPSGPAPSRARPLAPLIEPGRTCWRCARAQRAAVLVDGADYFAALDQAFRAARRSIDIVGWDFDGRIKLVGGSTAEGPTLGELLRSLVEERPELQVRILVWSLAVLHAPSGFKQLAFGEAWQEHPRIRVKLDMAHPIYGSQHQKIVVVDGKLAFSGGMDLTVDRWDTKEHVADDPRRRTPDGKPYAPVHDVQMMVDGEAARALAELTGRRWAEATGEAVEDAPAEGDPWPQSIAPDFERVDIAIARSLPQNGVHDEVEEAAALTDAALESAERYVFLEAQYMAAARVGERLEELLGRVAGPEIVIVLSHASRTFIERMVMGLNRDRLIRRLKRADRYDRLRAYYPVVPRGRRDLPVLVHSKVIAIDDRFLRIGSSNLNNRSIALDSECDLAIVAQDEAGRAAVRKIVCGLVGEHLGTAPERIDAELERRASLIGAIDVFNGGKRGLRRFRRISRSGPTRPLPLTGLLDPARVLQPFWFLRRKRQDS